jgi:sulfur transfer complex TusBCD TusB component (DsrH family)
MAKRILSVLSHPEYGNLEDSDIGLFASAFAPVAGSRMTVLLAEDAVNYGVRGQHGSDIEIAGGKVQPGFLIEQDIRAVREADIPVYAFAEDLEARGIAAADLIEGVTTISRKDFGRFIDQFDTVWNW